MKTTKKIICGIATMDSRKNSLNKVLKSLQNQTIKPDRIYIYNNDQQEFNATDNGKFFYFTTEESKKESCYYFSCDDDIYYPNDYIETMINSIEKEKCVVSHHGRILNRLNVSYYGGHQMFSCLRRNDYNGDIDVGGTGVTAFDTDYFKPLNVFESKFKRMCDLVFSLEAKKQNKRIVILKHNDKWLKDICDDLENSCFVNEKNNEIQTELSNEIIKLKNKKVSIIIPFNEDRGYLDLAIKSIQKQTYKNIEIVYSRSDKSVGYNLNRGIEQSSGQYIKYLCDDDMLTENSISDSILAIRDNDFIHGNAINFFDNGNETNHIPNIIKPTLNDMLITNQIHGGTLMYDKNVFEKYGLFDESLWTAEEYDYNLMLLSKGATIGYCNSFLYLYRRHNLQKSLGNKNASYQNKRKYEIERIKDKYRK